MVCDFIGEGSAILRLVEYVPISEDAISSVNWNAVPFVRVERDFRLLSAGAANGLYTLGGVLLTFMTPGLPSRIRSMMWATWIAGVTMTIAAIADHLPGMMASTAILFPLFLGWVAYLGVRWRPV